MHNAFQYTILQIFTGKYKKMITFVAQKKLFTSVFYLTMKKILTYICAGALVLSTFSCAKDPWNFTPDNRKVAPMTPAQVADNLNETGVAVLNETDPDLWKEWGQTGLKLMDQFYNEIDVEDAFDEFYEDLMEVMSAVTEQDTYKIVTTTIKLSQVKGDFTVSEGELVYTKSDNPFNLTFLYNDKTYVLKLEARDSNNQIMVNQRVDDYNKKKVYNILDVPSMAAIHVTENGNLYLDLVTYPIINDVDKDGKLGNNDTIEGSATLQIPGYKLELNSLKVSEDGGSARVAFYHNNKRVLAVDGGVELDFASQKENVKAVTRIFRVVDDTEFNILLADGKAVVKGQVDVEDIKKMSEGDIDDTEAGMKAIAAAVNKDCDVNLYFNGNSTVQASLVFMAVMSKDNDYWHIVPGLHFYDGSADITLEDFVKNYVGNFEDTVGKLASFKTKLTNYFHDLIAKLD